MLTRYENKAATLRAVKSPCEKCGSVDWQIKDMPGNAAITFHCPDCGNEKVLAEGEEQRALAGGRGSARLMT